MKKNLAIALIHLALLGMMPMLNAQTFSGIELLSRPTDNSIMVNTVANADMQAYFEYGTSPGSYTNQTSTVSATANEPLKAVMTGLSPNTRYYYRMVYSTNGGTTWVNRDQHSFYTQRAAGSTYKFAVLSDSHINIMLGTAAVSQAVMTNIANSNADYLIDLGDTFAMDNVATVANARSAFLFQRSSTYMGKFSASTPVFIATGNHEQQEGWHLDDKPDDPTLAPPILSTNAQKRYYPNPVPDGFYTGNTDTNPLIDGDHLHEDYYAWTWGDALFVVIDPFYYTTVKPFVGNTGGGEPETGTGDRWEWTLGQTQYNWLKQTLENSSAKYKFIFAHHMTGGSDDYVREGAYGAPYCEWGGYNENGTTYAFDTRRSGWYAPVHNLLVENHVSAFIHGHDHQYAYEVRDGVVYHSCASGGFTGNGFNLYSESDPMTLKVLPSAGHLVITVTPTQATVDYIGSSTGTSNYAYTIQPYNVTTYTLAAGNDGHGTVTLNPSGGTYASGTTVTLTPVANSGYVFDTWSGTNVGDIINTSGVYTIVMNANKSVTANFIVATGKKGDVNDDDAASSTDALIILSCDVDIDVSTFCPMNCGDVNGDGYVDSTDALIILSYDVGISVPYAIGQPGCESTVTPCPGCN